MTMQPLPHAAGHHAPFIGELCRQWLTAGTFGGGIRTSISNATLTDSFDWDYIPSDCFGEVIEQGSGG